VPLGIYISVPFCKTKCSYCNFASDVFSREKFAQYVSRVEQDIGDAEAFAAKHDLRFERAVDSIYLGGGTPTLLEPEQLKSMFAAVREKFGIRPEAEITVEAAPGTLTDAVIEMLLECGVNRVSFGVQSFVDQEARSVGRLHTREITLSDIARLRAAGIVNISLDLIAGLPHQTAESWRYSVDEVIATGVPHASVYMLEVDEDSRLGRELIAGGTRYHAHHVPDDGAVADFYGEACERFNAAGLRQYEISNFARTGAESLHNLKYWTRQPYLGFGVDSHSMLRSGAGSAEAARFAAPDSLEAFSAGLPSTISPVSQEQAVEEAFFLGLRLNRGVDLQQMHEEFGPEALGRHANTIQQLVLDELLEAEQGRVRLTERGRLFSNEVFERFILSATESRPEAASKAQPLVNIEISSAIQ
jgi:oxygen-independent coproporphyrinogen III oxidase